MCECLATQHLLSFVVLSAKTCLHPQRRIYQYITGYRKTPMDYFRFFLNFNLQSSFFLSKTCYFSLVND